MASLSGDLRALNVWDSQQVAYGSLEAYVGGSLLTLKTPKIRQAITAPGRRTEIKAFTSSSRRRLLKKIAKLRRDELPIFLSLTYPAEHPTDHKIYKGHLRALYKRIERKWRGASMVWRLEFQQRGAAHFHCLLYGVDLVDFLSAVSPDDENEKNRRLRWVDYAWDDVVKSGDDKHLYAGCNSTPVESSRGVMWYCAKYMSKLHTAPGEVGRYWGMMGRGTAPWAAKIVMRLIGPESWAIRRLLFRMLGRKVRGWRGTSVFCNPDRWPSLVMDGHFNGDG